MVSGSKEPVGKKVRIVGFRGCAHLTHEDAKAHPQHSTFLSSGSPGFSFILGGLLGLNLEWLGLRAGEFPGQYLPFTGGMAFTKPEG